MKRSLLSLSFIFLFAVLAFAQPAAPPTPTVSTNLCGDKILTTVAPPANVTYYWQGTSCGTSTATTGLTYTVTASGTYYIRAINTSSVWSTTCASVPVVVNPVPAMPPLPTVSANLCGPKVLTTVAPSAGITYYWQGTSCGVATTTTGLTYNVTASGTYYINAYTSAGCWSSCNSNIVTVNDIPVVSFTGLADTVLVTDPDILLHGVPYGGVFSGTGMTDSTFSPATAGVGSHTITYTYTTSPGCSNYQTKDVYVKSSIGINDINYDNFISVYPNPSKGTLNININVFSNARIEFSIVNILGAEVSYGNFINHDIQQLNVNNLSNGVYFLKLQSDNISYIKKIVIQK